jgi:glycosyltransferase involved in cell wall biosynthesis
MPKDITIIVAALNEEQNIEGAMESITTALDGVVDDYEILVFNDGSTDRTSEIAAECARKNPRIRVINNETNKGVGYVIGQGIKLASKPYISCFPGDNDMSGESLRFIAKQIGEVDLVVSYMQDMRHRSLPRRVLSRAYTGLLNALFGLKLRYYNGCFLYKTSVAQQLSLRSRGFGVFAECLVKMLKTKCSYREVAFVHTGRKAGKSSAVSPRSFANVAQTVVLLFSDVYFGPKVGSSPAGAELGDTTKLP